MQDAFTLRLKSALPSRRYENAFVCPRVSLAAGLCSMLCASRTGRTQDNGMGVIDRFEHEGVEGIRIGRYPIGINTTAIVYRLGATLIDTGPVNQWRFVRRFVREKPLCRVLITHHHEDHSGNGANLQREFGVPVFVPPLGQPLLRDGYPMHLYRRIFWGTPGRFDGVPMPEEIEFEDGLTLRAVHTAGHAEDMTCLLEPNRGWLFSGDLFIAATTRYLRTDEDYDEILRSLRLVLTHEFDTVFCAHRGVMPGGRAAIQAKLDALEALREQSRSLHQQGKSLRKITAALLGREDIVTWLSQGHFSKKNLIRGSLNGHGTGATPRRP